MTHCNISQLQCRISIAVEDPRRRCRSFRRPSRGTGTCMEQMESEVPRVYPNSCRFLFEVSLACPKGYNKSIVVHMVKYIHR